MLMEQRYSAIKGRHTVGRAKLLQLYIYQRMGASIRFLQGMIKGLKMGQIGVYVAPLGPPERPRVPPAPQWSWLAGCRRKLWSKSLRSKIKVVNVAVLGSLRSIRIGTSRHAAGRGGRATEASTCCSSVWMTVPTLQPQNTQVVTQNEEFEPIWTHLGRARTMPIR